jgi:hypothetical protein
MDIYFQDMMGSARPKLGLANPTIGLEWMRILGSISKLVIGVR